MQFHFVRVDFSSHMDAPSVLRMKIPQKRSVYGQKHLRNVVNGSRRVQVVTHSLLFKMTKLRS